MSNPKPVAYHEAGHVVAFCVLYGRVHFAELCDVARGVGALGMTYFFHPQSEVAFDEQLQLSLMVATLAGPYAEARYAKRNFMNALRTGGLGDLGNYLNLTTMGRIGGDESTFEKIRRAGESLFVQTGQLSTP